MSEKPSTTPEQKVATIEWENYIPESLKQKLTPEQTKQLGKSLIIDKSTLSLESLKTEVAKNSPDLSAKLTEDDYAALYDKMKNGDSLLETAGKAVEQGVDAVTEFGTNLKDAVEEKTGIKTAEKALGFFDTLKEKWEMITKAFEKGDFFSAIKILFSGDFWDFRSLQEKMNEGVTKLAKIIGIDEQKLKAWQKLLGNDDDFSKEFGKVKVEKLLDLAKNSTNPLSDLGISGDNEKTKDFIAGTFTQDNFVKIINKADISETTAKDMTLGDFMGKVGKV